MERYVIRPAYNINHRMNDKGEMRTIAKYCKMQFHDFAEARYQKNRVGAMLDMEFEVRRAKSGDR